MIQLKHVSKSFDDGETFVVDDVSLRIETSEILILLGSSGSGKTTTLKMINRLVEPSQGVIEIDGENVLHCDVIALRRRMGYVFQGTGLFPHMSVEDNIAIILKLMGQPIKKRIQRSHELLDMINLDPSIYAERLPEELSGGQRQRVGVARALAADPNILLMDEPFGALDAITREELQDELLRLNRELHKTIVFVTHDLSEAIKLGDKIAIMHEGRLQQVGTYQEILQKPATTFVKDLFATQEQNG